MNEWEQLCDHGKPVSDLVTSSLKFSVIPKSKRGTYLEMKSMRKMNMGGGGAWGKEKELVDQLTTFSST